QVGLRVTCREQATCHWLSPARCSDPIKSSFRGSLQVLPLVLLSRAARVESGCCLLVDRGLVPTSPCASPMIAFLR
ncbi:uncharacterized protein L969DRAFT_90438, partial [Mixia osmundae IAM 14324]|uniref:uncharacterized protein n=1 Tax=Mixia osmundae (strain CBS 9802 / IAM 14324 / JCM 22182 / KY 12970) TaxID=764103 RepID=UPI0004A546B2